jgi:hypothetical protein
MQCHPSYQGEGPWFDWVNVQFAVCIFNEEEFSEGNYPCKVMAIVPKQKNSFLKETAVVVQSAQKCTGSDSVLFAEWELCDGYHIVEVSRVLESLFVLEIGSKRIAVALPYSDCGLLVLLIHATCENNRNIFTLLILFIGKKFTPA